MLIVFVLLITFVISSLTYLSYLYVKAEVWLYYLIIIGTCLIIFIVVCLLNYCIRGRSPHVHHYQFGLVVVCLLGVNDPFMSLVAGLAAAIYVEGSTRWGMSNVF